MNDVHYSSDKHDWATPKEFFAIVNEEFNLDFDVCASQENRKLVRYWDKDDDALKQDWSNLRCWMNPPYGYGIGKWVEKAYNEAQRAQIVVCLIPARTDTAWWHDYVMHSAEIRFIRGRLNFGGDRKSGHNAPFPCVIVVFYPFLTELKVSSMWRGY